MVNSLNTCCKGVASAKQRQLRRRLIWRPLLSEGSCLWYPMWTQRAAINTSDVSPKTDSSICPFSRPSGVATGNTIPAVTEDTVLREQQQDTIRPVMQAQFPFDDLRAMTLVSRGNFGKVCRAEYGTVMAAVKIIERGCDEDGGFSMGSEGPLSMTLAHPNIVQTFGFGCRCGQGIGEQLQVFSELWIVQEWCSMGTLNQKIMAGDIASDDDCQEGIEIAAQIAGAMSYVHGNGIIHGDLTSSNVFITRSANKAEYAVKVGDFGLSMILPPGQTQVNSRFTGTVTFMPPELFLDEGSSLTMAVDLYSFGAILWQFCTMSQPFKGLSPVQVFVAMATGVKLEFPPESPVRIEKLSRRCVHASPQERPLAKDMLEELLSECSQFSVDEDKHLAQ